jgi:L-lactate dehydrogenase (cytochrome)
MAHEAVCGIRLQPRGLVHIEKRDLRPTLMGKDYALPFGIAPMGMCELAWAGADRMMAQLARDRHMPIGVSTAASTTIGDLNRMSQEHAWFQLYPVADDEITQALIALARRSGCDVLVLTIDVPLLSRRPRELRSGFHVPFRFGPRQIADFALHPRWSLSRLAAGMPQPANFAAASPGKFERAQVRGKVTRQFLARLRDSWPGKLVVKGVMNVEDACTVRGLGADAIYVSGHGGRQLDSLPPPIYQLAAIRDALGPDIPLIYDTGVRSGEDIVTVLAAGADFVMLGRPFLYAIGADGDRGLRTVCNNLAEEVSITMAQIGLCTIAEIDRSALSAWQPPGCPASLRGTDKEGPDG